MMLKSSAKAFWKSLHKYFEILAIINGCECIVTSESSMHFIIEIYCAWLCVLHQVPPPPPPS